MSVLLAERRVCEGSNKAITKAAAAQAAATHALRFAAQRSGPLMVARLRSPGDARRRNVSGLVSLKMRAWWID
jgi:hypothetical protein